MSTKIALLLSYFALGSIASGCSLAPVISHNSVDYNHTVEDVTNNILITNILRARDGAPLFFSDISQIRGSISTNLMAQTSFPFGPDNRPPTGTGVRNSAQGSLSIITNPTFDIAPSNTKQFYQGILQPVSKNVIAYYINRGIDTDILFNLLVSNIEVVETRGGISVVTRSIPWSSQGNNEYAASPEFVATVRDWAASGRRPRVVVTAGGSNFGPPVPADARAIVSAKIADLDARPAGEGLVQFVKKAQQTHICIGSAEVEVIASSITKAIGPDELPKRNSVCTADRSAAASGGGKNQDVIHYRIRTRSVEGMFYYLGSLIQSGEAPPIPFRIHEGATDRARFTLLYRGREYSVNNLGPGDGTLPILAILNDLLNINRDANEVPTTKAVQAVGSG